MKKLIVLLLVSILFSSCGGGASLVAHYNKYITVENKAIPPEIGTEDNYVICLTHSSSLYKLTQKTFPPQYKGKYIFLNSEELKSSKYSNTNIYRYIFSSDSQYSVGNVILGTPGGSNIQFTVFDRKAEVLYTPKIYSNYREKFIMVYAQKLEAQRLLNQKKKN